MLDNAQRQKEIEQYHGRLDELYRSVADWVRSREPSAKFTETVVELAEQSIGAYKAKSFEIARPGKTAIRLIPKGIFIIGAHGRVDATSRLGREILVWTEKGGPHISTTIKEGARVLEQVTRPLYRNVEEGWAWGDERRRRLLHLTEDVFWNSVVASLSE